MIEKSPDKKEDSRSGVPKYDFADTLGEQERQLKDNPMMKRFSESRKALSADPHRPLYHFVSPERGGGFRERQTMRGHACLSRPARQPGRIAALAGPRCGARITGCLGVEEHLCG